jgi:hypothetical protein
MARRSKDKLLFRPVSSSPLLNSFLSIRCKCSASSKCGSRYVPAGLPNHLFYHVLTYYAKTELAGNLPSRFQRSHHRPRSKPLHHHSIRILRLLGISALLQAQREWRVQGRSERNVCICQLVPSSCPVCLFNTHPGNEHGLMSC